MDSLFERAALIRAEKTGLYRCQEINNDLQFETHHRILGGHGTLSTQPLAFWDIRDAVTI